MAQWERLGDVIAIETNRLIARIKTKGYVSGVAAGSLVDKLTGAIELGFGTQIADFLLEPGGPGDPIDEQQYQFGPDNEVHGNLAKRYVEGPQICTQAKELEPEVVSGPNFVAVKLGFTFTQGYGDYQAGSRWEQWLIFVDGQRYYLGADAITSANDCPALIFRQDLPGHIRHLDGSAFEHVYLSYESAYLPSTDFFINFPPDEKFLYQRDDAQIPKHMIRAYQVRHRGEAGPWLAGITLRPADVYEAWCHQRTGNYVCMIQEIGGRAIKKGQKFGAAYAIGWFDSIREMEEVADEHAGASGLALEGPADQPTGFRKLTHEQLNP